MVALSATAVGTHFWPTESTTHLFQIHAALDDFGEPRGSFSAELYKDIYLRHVATLENIKVLKPRAFHVIMASLYTSW